MMRPMLLSQTAVYGLRAMAVLAALPPNESIRALELSGRTGVPRQYLAKVMRRLVVAGLVRSRRGHGGGFMLSRPARAIRLGDVLRSIDAELEGGTCAFGFGACDPQNPCALHPVWSRFSDSVQKWAEGSTLADLGPEPKIRTRRQRS
jgi:Rrf2 family protein